MTFKFYDLRHTTGEFLGYEYGNNVDEVRRRYRCEVSVCKTNANNRYIVFAKYSTTLYLEATNGVVYRVDVTDIMRKAWPLRQRFTSPFIEKVSSQLEGYNFTVKENGRSNLYDIFLEVSKKVK